MDNLINWIADNKEWLFSGIGVAFISFLFGFLTNQSFFQILKGINWKKGKKQLSAVWDYTGFDIQLKNQVIDDNYFFPLATIKIPV